MYIWIIDVYGKDECLVKQETFPDEFRLLLGLPVWHKPTMRRYGQGMQRC